MMEMIWTEGPKSAFGANEDPFLCNMVLHLAEPCATGEGVYFGVIICEVSLTAYLGTELIVDI